MHEKKKHSENSYSIVLKHLYKQFVENEWNLSQKLMTYNFARVFPFQPHNPFPTDSKKNQEYEIKVNKINDMYANKINKLLAALDKKLMKRNFKQAQRYIQNKYQKKNPLKRPKITLKHTR